MRVAIEGAAGHLGWGSTVVGLSGAAAIQSPPLCGCVLAGLSAGLLSLVLKGVQQAELRSDSRWWRFCRTVQPRVVDVPRGVATDVPSQELWPLRPLIAAGGDDLHANILMTSVSVQT